MVHVRLPSTGEVTFLVFVRLENKKQFCVLSYIIKDIIHGLCMIGINNSVVCLMIVTFVCTSITCDEAIFFFGRKKNTFSPSKKKSPDHRLVLLPR